MRVAHLIDSGGLYGAEQMLLSLCCEQKQQGLIPIILSCGLPDERLKPLEIAAKEMDIDVIAWRMSAGINVAGMREILAHLKSLGVDILHSHGYKFNILLGLLTKSAVGLPIVTTVHGYIKASFPKKMWFYEVLDRIFLRRFDKIIVVSQKMLEIPAFKQLKSKVQVIHNGIPQSVVNDVPSFAETKVINLLAIGRLSSEKGFEYLIKAIGSLNAGADKYRLTIFGEGALRISLELLIRDLKQENNIKIAGFVSNAQQYFCEYDAIIMPSLTEGIPITLLEAMRNKVMILASKVGGIPEALGESSECLFESASSEAIVKIIDRWFETKCELDSIKDANYQRYIEQFTSKKMANEYKDVYQSCV